VVAWFKRETVRQIARATRDISTGRLETDLKVEPKDLRLDLRLESGDLGLDSRLGAKDLGLDGRDLRTSLVWCEKSVCGMG